MEQLKNWYESLTDAQKSSPNPANLQKLIELAIQAAQSPNADPAYLANIIINLKKDAPITLDRALEKELNAAQYDAVKNAVLAAEVKGSKIAPMIPVAADMLARHLPDAAPELNWIGSHCTTEANLDKASEAIKSKLQNNVGKLLSIEWAKLQANAKNLFKLYDRIFQNEQAWLDVKAQLSPAKKTASPKPASRKTTATAAESTEWQLKTDATLQQILEAIHALPSQINAQPNPIAASGDTALAIENETLRKQIEAYRADAASIHEREAAVEQKYLALEQQLRQMQTATQNNEGKASEAEAMNVSLLRQIDMLKAAAALDAERVKRAEEEASRLRAAAPQLEKKASSFIAQASANALAEKLRKAEADNATLRKQLESAKRTAETAPAGKIDLYTNEEVSEATIQRRIQRYKDGLIRELRPILRDLHDISPNDKDSVNMMQLLVEDVFDTLQRNGVKVEE